MLFKLALILHILGATIWIGGHLVLVLGILPRALKEERTGGSAGARRVLEFEQSFAWPGLLALALQLVTGIYLANVYLGGWEGWRKVLSEEAAPAAHSVLAKLALLIATALLGGHAYHRVLPRLERAAADSTGGPGIRARALRSFAVHAWCATLLALLLLIVGASIRFGGLFEHLGA